MLITVLWYNLKCPFLYFIYPRFYIGESLYVGVWARVCVPVLEWWMIISLFVMENPCWVQPTLLLKYSQTWVLKTRKYFRNSCLKRFQTWNYNVAARLVNLRCANIFSHTRVSHSRVVWCFYSNRDAGRTADRLPDTSERRHEVFTPITNSKISYCKVKCIVFSII